MKILNKALISTAVFAGLYAGSAFAGTEACFEVYKGAVNANHATKFAAAQCYTGTVRDGNLAALDEGRVAYELTKGTAAGYAIDLGNTVWGAPATEGLQIVYIPTTDIPGATRVKVKLGNAKFNGNSNQIFLMGSGDQVLATSDGVVDGQDEIVFLTQSGTTIPAGTRMLFSKANVLASHAPVGIITKSDECTNDASKAKITIAATAANTDGGSAIIGGVSRAETLIDISAQFYTFQGTTLEGQVNAQTKNFDDAEIVARTEFVYDTASNAGLKLRKQELVAPYTFVDRGLATGTNLELKHTLTNADKVKVKFTTTADAGASARFFMHNEQAATGVVSNPIALGASNFGVLGTQYTKNAPLFFDRVEGVNEDSFVPASFGTGFGPSAASNTVFVTVQQSDLTKPLGFNYNVNVDSVLEFDNAALLDHCAKTTNTHQVGINGAVLKVPYTVAGEGNFVRITNEHNQVAEVTVDVFSESVDGTVGQRHATAVRLANIPAKSSYVYFVPEIIAEAQTQKNYSGTDGAPQTANTGNNLRHSMTFAVTAPKDTVHGVTVQRLSTGNDRVMPVLDQNNWSQ